MLFIGEYTFHKDLDQGDFKRLMDIFGARGAAPGEIAHYVRADGSGGVTIVELDDATKMYEVSLAYAEFMDFKITPALKIDDAIAPIFAQLAANG